jgi:hypothetical protein
MLIFHLYGQPSLNNRLELFLAGAVVSRRNQLCKLSERSVKGFLFGGCPKIACSHRAQSPLTLFLALMRLHMICCFLLVGLRLLFYHVVFTS